MTVCNILFDAAYMVYGLTKFKMFYMHTDRAAKNSIHCVHIFPAIFKNDDASQRGNWINHINFIARNIYDNISINVKIMEARATAANVYI